MPAFVFAAPRFGGSSIDYRSDLCVDLDQELHPGDQGLNIRKCTRTVSVATLLGDRAGPSRRRRPGDTNRQDVGTVSLLQNASGRACPHNHAVGKCEPPSFDSAGPHFNPGNTHMALWRGLVMLATCRTCTFRRPARSKSNWLIRQSPKA
jgi:hypothetical protein